MFVRKAEEQKRPLSSWERQRVDEKIKEAAALKPRVEAAKAKAAPSSRSTVEMRAKLAKHNPQFATAPPRQEKRGGEMLMPKRFSRDYYDSFYANLGSGGALNAAMYEGSSPAGGYAIPIEVAGLIVPLAPADSAVRRLAKVIGTRADLKVAQAITRA